MGILTSRPPADLSSADEEPDYRYTLANERTYLAWIRTAMALLAAGVAAHQLLALPSGALQMTITMVCFGLATVLASGAYLRWKAAQSAIRRNLPLPGSVLVPALALGLGILTLLAAGAALWS
ncbi:DUF202 domain-containing protein [Rhodococcus sp. A14]|uniref:DUF202 domain-containing protein n=1 Tax=Rhodococcus sp. A14 TaxID=1194106 RepID=UPI001422EC68|nr:DUF202 domain-containing protein [Rhodococcus sp. A14]